MRNIDPKMWGKCDINVFQCRRMLLNVSEMLKKMLTNVGVKMLDKCFPMSVEMWSTAIQCHLMLNNVR
jgi:hypothetical protein